jgi:N utilization substance protein B
MATGPRRRARVLALQALYEADTTHHPVEGTLERLVGEHTAPETVAAFARRLVAGVQAHRGQIDAILAETAPQWPVEDVAVVDRNILRIAIYEVLFDNETPIRAAVNEAVELAKIYGGESSPRFVNGVLGTVSARASR